MRNVPLITMLLLLAILCPVEATALPQEVEELLPQEAAELLEDVERDENGAPGLLQGLSLLGERACRAVREVIGEKLHSVVMLMGVILLCSLAQECSAAAGSDQALVVVPLAGAMAVILISAGNIHAMAGLGVEVIDQLDQLSKALLPTLMAAVAAGGGAASAGVRHVAAVFFTDILITVIRDLLLPLVYLYVAAAGADILLPGKRLRTIADGIRKGTVWLLSGILLLYTGYLTLAGAMSGSADNLSVQLAGAAMKAVPVVGGIISGAAGTVLAGASVLKGTIGTVGTLAVLAICLVPFLELAIQYLLYKAAAFAAGAVGTPQLLRLIDALGNAFGLLLGMAGACALLLLISMISAVMVVSR